jgi:hypothetical protein
MSNARTMSEAGTSSREKGARAALTDSSPNCATAPGDQS